MVSENAVAFEQAAGRTVLKTLRATSPLRLLTPRNHGSGAWVIGANLGGGFVDGDSIRLDVEVGPGALALLGTQASTKVYRCPTATCKQDIRAHVAQGGFLVSLPDPVVCFAEARYEQSMTIDMRASASLVYVDSFTAGRSECGERWEFLRYVSRARVVREEETILLDAILLDPRMGALARRMGRFDAFATIVAVGPAATPVVETILSTAKESPRDRPDAPIVSAVSPLEEGSVLVRIAGVSAEAVSACVRAFLTPLAALLGDDPFARKW